MVGNTIKKFPLGGLGGLCWASMEIVINRKIRADAYWIDGELSIDDNIVCGTLENAEHCLPEGRYTVSIEQSSKLGRKVPVLINSEDPSIMAEIGFGNGAYKIMDGTIIVGQSHVSGLLISSFKTFLQLFDRIRNAMKRNCEVIVSIK